MAMATVEMAHVATRRLNKVASGSHQVNNRINNISRDICKNRVKNTNKANGGSINNTHINNTHNSTNTRETQEKEGICNATGTNGK